MPFSPIPIVARPYLKNQSINVGIGPPIVDCGRFAAFGISIVDTLGNAGEGSAAARAASPSPRKNSRPMTVIMQRQ